MSNGAKRPLKFPPHYLEQLIESSPDIVVAVDRAGAIVYYNDGAEKNLGYTAGEILGENVNQIYPSVDEARRVMAAMRSEDYGGPGKVKNFETVFVDRWGQLLPVAISGSILCDDAGFEIGSIGFAKDIREIRRRDRLATLGEVAVAVCHEINNPLEAIVNQVELIDHFVRETATDERAIVEEERITAMRHELFKIQTIINRLVEMSKGAQYATREYHEGTQMADLATREGAPDDGKKAPCSAPGAGASRADSLAGIRALVVDDDAAVRNSVRDLLQCEGAQVLTAENGLEALHIFEQAPIDVIISDVVMPDLDGYDLYMEIKRRSTTPVLLMTGYYYDRDHVIKRSRLEGLQGVLFKKPVDPERLKALIRELCHRQPEPATATA
ncbi:MAG: response regulator [Deltaproteobacteria bacterium]|nr:response regulator [Deltaproteobacteria bacterium]